MSPSSLEPSPLQPAQDMQTRPAVPTGLLHLCPLVNSWSAEGSPPTPEGARLLFFLWGLCPEAGIHSSSGQAPSSGPTPNPKMTSGPLTGDPDPTAISGASPQTLDWPPCQAGSLTHPQPTGKCPGSAPGGAASGSAECPEGLPVHWGSGQKTCARVCFLVAARQPGHFLETCRQRTEHTARTPLPPTLQPHYGGQPLLAVSTGPGYQPGGAVASRPGSGGSHRRGT